MLPCHLSPHLEHIDNQINLAATDLFNRWRNVKNNVKSMSSLTGVFPFFSKLKFTWKPNPITALDNKHQFMNISETGPAYFHKKL